MNLKHNSKLALVSLAAAGLILAGCQEKKPVEEQKTKPVETMASQPSSNSVYFAFDSSELDAASKAILNAHAAWLNDNSDDITIEGNCDERGSREYNLALGQRRADSVKDYLVSHGVSASRIDTVSFGEERPACTGSGEACWAQNRHADIVGR